MGTSWLVHSAFIGPKLANSRDGSAEKVFWACPSMPMDRKPWFFAIATGWCIGFIKMGGNSWQKSFCHTTSGPPTAPNQANRAAGRKQVQELSQALLRHLGRVVPPLVQELQVSDWRPTSGMAWPPRAATPSSSRDNTYPRQVCGPYDHDCISFPSYCPLLYPAARISQSFPKWVVVWAF